MDETGAVTFVLFTLAVLGLPWHRVHRYAMSARSVLGLLVLAGGICVGTADPHRMPCAFGCHWELVESPVSSVQWGALGLLVLAFLGWRYARPAEVRVLRAVAFYAAGVTVCSTVASLVPTSVREVDTLCGVAVGAASLLALCLVLEVKLDRSPLPRAALRQRGSRLARSRRVIAHFVTARPLHDEAS